MSIFNFENYKEYLQFYIKSQPQRGRGEVTRFAQHLGVNTTLVSQVLNGSKDFTSEQIFSLSQYLALSDLETDYFVALLTYERSGTHQLKKYWKSKIQKIREDSKQISSRIHKDRILTEQEKAIFYSSWMYAAVRVLSSIPEYQDIESISKKLNIQRERVVEILKFLTEHGLCISEASKFKMGPARIHLEASSPLVKQHHRNWRLRAMEKSESISEDELMFSSVISLSKKDYKWLREELVLLIKKISERVKDSESEELASLNLDWFKL